jgi:hypothetical protein
MSSCARVAGQPQLPGVRVRNAGFDALEITVRSLFERPATGDRQPGTRIMRTALGESAFRPAKFRAYEVVVFNASLSE